MGFEPTRAEHNGLAVHRLNHSATPSDDSNVARQYISSSNKVATICTVFNTSCQFFKGRNS